MATPTIGRIVQYQLSPSDAEEINRRRADFDRTAEGNGYQAHVGNFAEEGQTFPAMVVRVWNEADVQLQVFLDGNDTLWATSRHQGEGPGYWAWPTAA